VNKDYYEVLDSLYNTADEYNCDALCVCCYKNLLDTKWHIPRIYGYEGVPIYMFALDHPTGTYIIRVDGHLTCVQNGKCYDIWNCTNELIDIVWKVD
jgi:hypothetical protein